MVAAGATGLMSASESSSSKEAENIPLNCKVQNAQRSSDSSAKTSVKVEKKNSIRSPNSNKTFTSIRETKASRLRAASIVSPTEATPSNRKSFIADHLSTPNSLQTGTNSLRKPKSPMSSTGKPIATCGSREKDKTPKRNSGANKYLDSKEKQPANTSCHEKSEKTRMRKQLGKPCIKGGSIADGSSEGHDATATGTRLQTQQQSTVCRTTARASSTIPSSSGVKSSAITQRSSSAGDTSEVSRRVDALTALTRATMERVERLTCHSSPSINGRLRTAISELDSSGPLVSSRKPSSIIDVTEANNSGLDEASISRVNLNNDTAETNFTSRQQIPPISILKHKTSDLESSPSSSIFPYTTPGSPSTSGPGSIVQQFTKKHGILKKRSSLDDNEILRRRRSCSPDTAYLENNAIGFKPILMTERRSSLDELVKRSRSPDQVQHHPTSILKRKSSGDEEREDGQAGSTEPTSILKRSSGNNGKPVGIGNHVSIVAAVAKTLGCTPDNINGSEVRPILKKNYSRDDSSSSDPTSLEPRPILKKKSSTDSDEHDERPKKTILKSSRKSSQEDSGNEIDGASPKKLSMLKNRSVQRRTNSLPECDVVRPILKQCSPRESSSPSRSSLSGTASPGDGATAISKDLFLRKRAQSVGHMQSSLNGREDWLELEDSLRQEKISISQKFIYPSPSQNITWLNIFTATATTTASTVTATNTATATATATDIATDTATAADTVTANADTDTDANADTDTDTDTAAAITTATPSIARIVSFKLPIREETKHRYDSDSSPNVPCPEIGQIFDKSCTNDYEVSSMCRQSSSRRRDKREPRMVHGEHPPSKSQKSHNFETGKSDRDERKAIGAQMAERKTNVSQIAQRFKALEEQVKVTMTESRVERKITASSEKYRRDSYEQQKHERFNTQPVTYEEVREAVLLNQRNAGTIELSQPNDNDPSKLSLADRVQMFNEIIATESIAKVGISLDRSQRRRPANRYKTQPITSEEVEVAARSFPSEIVEPRTSRLISHPREPLVNDIVQPRSILKYSQAQSVSETCWKSVSDIGTRRMLQRRDRSIDCVPSGRVITFESNPSEQEPQETTVDCSSESVVFSEPDCASESIISLETKNKMITEMDKRNFPSISIADRLAALERSGTTDWKRRVNTEPVPASSSLAKVTENAEKDELSTRQKKLAERLEKLESAAEGWRKRVVAPDAAKFSVAGKMMVNHLQVENLQVDRQLQGDGKKKTPQPERFRSYKSSNLRMTTNSQEGSIIQEVSSEHNSEDSGEESTSFGEKCSIWTVPRADDETFTSFFSNVSLAKCEAETLDFAESDFDVVTTFSERLGTRRTVKTQRRRLQSKNPLRTLAARTDLKDEYTEMSTGVAERVMRRLNLEKLGKNSSLAIEALAGLASTEDFSSVTLKNVVADSTGYGNTLPPYKDVMLILVKGRRHVQVRLVEPVAASINSGDNYILVTKTELYNYIGKYSNVIERARGAEIALSIQQNRDLGCRASQVITVSEEKVTCTNNDIVNFWKILGVDDNNVEVIDGGHPDEDELYESALMETNMVYEVVGEYELLPIDKYWGTVPKIEMLDPSKILVFDFGSEMYIWNGKIAPPEKRKVATHLAQELWREGYDYTECTVSPINSASIIGRRKKLENNDKKASERPTWCLIAKLTQHMETILFREKFLDWPNVTGIIRLKKSEEKEHVDGKMMVEPPEVDALIGFKGPVVDLILEGSHLGRGTGWYDDELLRQSVVSTTNVTVWHIDEFSYSLLDGSSIGQFYTGDSYIVRWMYTVTVTGRGLGGEPSKHASKGRDRCAYFIWQGQKASLNEQGTAALLTVQLDQEQGPQIRVVEGFEPAAFLNLFSGKMMVHMGKRSKNLSNPRWRLYTYRGSEESEICLTQVPCSSRQLRSRGALVLIDGKFGEIYVWYGSAALDNLKQNVLKAAEILKANRPGEAALSHHSDLTIHHINEADEEPAVFYQALGGMNKQLYVSLDENSPLNHTPRLFNLSSVSGEFAATELLCPHRTNLAMPFPFLQNELYQVNQPALFLLDNKDELWLWQGWWPDGGSEDQIGSGAVRWQAERRAAMVMAVRYWQKHNPESNECPVYLAWAGLEPLSFTNLFPTWTLHDEIAELNIRDGRDPGQVLKVEGELARLTQSAYPPAQLLQRPLPEGVDPTILEQYLSPQHFEELLGMNAEEYGQLPAWKQINIKKKIGLF